MQIRAIVIGAERSLGRVPTELHLRTHAVRQCTMVAKLGLSCTKASSTARNVAAHHRTAVEASAAAFVDSVGGLYGGATQLGDPGVADGRAGATVAGHRE